MQPLRSTIATIERTMMRNEMEIRRLQNTHEEADYPIILPVVG